MLAYGAIVRRFENEHFGRNLLVRCVLWPDRESSSAGSSCASYWLTLCLFEFAPKSGKRDGAGVTSVYVLASVPYKMGQRDYKGLRNSLQK